MRLIDADKLELKHYIQRVSDKVIRYNGTQPEYANYDILAYDIVNAPTVKAIPIEWFEWLLDTMGDGMYNLRAVIKDWERYKEDWGKENETN